MKGGGKAGKEGRRQGRGRKREGMKVKTREDKKGKVREA